MVEDKIKKETSRAFKSVELETPKGSHQGYFWLSPFNRIKVHVYFPFNWQMVEDNIKKETSRAFESVELENPKGSHQAAIHPNLHLGSVITLIVCQNAYNLDYNMY